MPQYSKTTEQEFIEMRRHQLIVRRRFKPRNPPSRRSSKHPSVGMMVKPLRIVNEVSLEAIFNHPAWK